MNTDDQHDFLNPRGGPAPLTPSDLAEQLAADHPELSIQPDAPLVGGMGAVYRATRTTSHGTRPVAIKVLHWHLMDDPSFIARFKREQAILSELDHPNIVKLHDTGETAEGLPFLVMDWIEGRSLTEFTQPGSTTDRQLLLGIADDLCAATQYAHNVEYKDAQGVPHKGILHRDLKPQNIIVTAEGRAIVLDFGIARPLTPGHTLTQPGDAHGTHGYIAPEVLAGEKPDARADIYSLGIIIYQLLMKKLPEAFAARPSEHSLDPRFDDIVMKAAASEREKRYKTAGELKRALELIPTMNVNPTDAHASASAEKTTQHTPEGKSTAGPVIEIDDYRITINGLDFTFVATIEQVVEALGPYSRIKMVLTGRNKIHPDEADSVDAAIYVWDELGISVIIQVSWVANPVVLRFDLNFEALSRVTLPESDALQIIHDAPFRQTYPKSTFRGTLTLNGRRISAADSSHIILAAREHNYRFGAYPENDAGNVFAMLSPGYKIRPNSDDRKDWLPAQIQSDYLKESIVKIGTFHTGNINDPLMLFSFWPICVPHNFGTSILNVPGIDIGSCVGKITCYKHTKLPLAKNEYVLMSAPGGSFSGRGDMGYYTNSSIFHTHFILTNQRVLARCCEDFNLEKWDWNTSYSLSEFPKCERFHTKSQGIEAMRYHKEKLGKTYPSLALVLYELFSSKKKSNENLALYVRIKANGDEIKEFRTSFRVNPLDNEDIMQMEFAKQQISFLFHCAGLLAYGRNIRRFPNCASSSHVTQELDRENSSLHPCRTCGRDVARSARACPHCGENLQGLQKPSGWRQKACSSCPSPMSRFAEKCQMCGHPNTWIKVQSFAATLAVLGTGLWSFLHFQQHLTAGIALPLMAMTVALGWRGTIFLLKSFYGH